MKFLCTECSDKKDSTDKSIPAILRYQDPRIHSVHKSAQELGLNFVILSGKYGLLKPNQEIPYYDHLLQSSEVIEHSNLIAEQIQSLHITEIKFISSMSPILEPYYNCLKLAAEKARVAFEFENKNNF